ncbi:MAG: DUF58 domain-containing protein [Bacteroidales bacterium]|jgi:uncharacterized protein (DUF58 family)|nr:DUF58 domain-containing protein [Bacteroidales bacterium]MDY4789762.1 DUF58 domain-containing protein [Bacteroidales bacterium]
MEEDLLKKVRKIEIKTRRLSKNIFSGQYHSAFKGRGMSFSEVREYNYGDEVRSIDWNVTARFNHPYVKVFEEERELTVILLIDVSGSTFFGTNGSLKSDIITEIAAVLSFSAIANNDKVGVIFFSNKVEKYIPAKKGSSHILRIIKELITYKQSNTKTSFDIPLKFMNNVIKKRSTCFLITDAFGNFDDSLEIISRKHDFSTIIVRDKKEDIIPSIGLVRLYDNETGKQIWIDSSDKNLLKHFSDQREKQDYILKQKFNRLGIDSIMVYTGEDYIRSLIKLFERGGRL